MKRNALKAFCVILAVTLAALSLASCGTKVQTSSFYEQYLYSGETVITDKNGSQVKTLSGTDGDYFDITLESPSVIDTLVIKEKTNSVTDFEILVKKDGEFVSIYEQDLIGSFRYCAFEDVQTDAVRLKINSANGGSFKISSVELLNSAHSVSDFRIASYVICDRVYDISSLCAEHFEVITDVILFGAASFDENGNISYNDLEINGVTVDGKTAILQAVENIKSVSQGKDIKFYVNILGPGGADDDEKQELHTQCFKEHGDEFIENINALLSELNMDGIYFDYEYPYKKKHTKAYSEFLVKLKDGIGDKKIGAALGPWGNALTDEAQDAVDFVEDMAYDIFDDNGYHASFASDGGALSFDYFTKNGYDIQKCDLGVPFYGRPVDGDGIWLGYNSCYETLGKFGNTDSTTVYVDEDRPEYSVERYYNGYQMIFDKTAFAYDYGAGGMMVWHYSCDAAADTGLSLFEAMREALETRQA